MLARHGSAWQYRARASSVLCKAKGFGGTATQQPGKTKKGSKRVTKEERRKEREVAEAEPAVVTVQREALNSLHHHLAAGVVPAHINGPDPGAGRQFHEQNQSRLRSLLEHSAVATGVLDIEQREQQLEQEYEQELDGSSQAGAASAAATVIDVEFTPAGMGSAADILANGTAAGANSRSAGAGAGTGYAAGSAAAAPTDAGTQSPVLLDEQELASRIARLWDDVPDELRELMASVQEPSLDAAATGPGEDQIAGGHSASAASPLATGSAASSLAGLADLDALLAPLEPKTSESEVSSQGPVTSAAEAGASNNANERGTIDYSSITEHLANIDEMEAMLVAATTAAAAEVANELADDGEDGEGSIGSVRVMALQQEVASANKKVELLEQQLHDSEEHARLLAQEVKLLQLQHSAGTYSSEQPAAEKEGHHPQHQQLLSELEMQVAQIANELLMVSLSMKNIDVAERRQLRGIVNHLLALKFSGTVDSQ